MKEEEAKMGGGKKETSKSHDFNISGPKHLAVVDWGNSYHQATVAASLVQGVNIMERDKAKKREPLANPWSEFFGFSLDEHLINEADGSIHGAIFKFDFNKNTPHSGVPPPYVIAFRGTMLTFKTGLSDLKQDLRCIMTNLEDGKRYRHAIQAIEKVLATGETTSVWLAGHSLGAAIALLAGEEMARLGFVLKTYAFNPPCPSLPTEIIPGSDVFKYGFRFATNLTKATIAVGLASFFDHQIQLEDDPRTAAWTPHLYVNPEDIICAEYIGYFEDKKFMSDIGFSKIKRAADSFSIRSRLFGGQGIQHLSSADMTLNRTDDETKDWWEISTIAHGLKQWWDPVLQANWESRSIRPSVEC